jgi:hypothetical protein
VYEWVENTLSIEVVIDGMDADYDAIRDRLQVMHIDETVSVSEGTMWYAEDPKTGCIGLGDVEAEAVGNAISVIVEYQRDTVSGQPYVKTPGRVVQKSWTDDQAGVFERIRELL